MRKTEYVDLHTAKSIVLFVSGKKLAEVVSEDDRCYDESLACAGIILDLSRQIRADDEAFDRRLMQKIADETLSLSQAVKEDLARFGATKDDELLIVYHLTNLALVDYFPGCIKPKPGLTLDELYVAITENRRLVLKSMGIAFKR